MWGPAVGWAAVLFLLSEIRGASLGASSAINDKIVHLALYSILGALLGWAAFASRRARWPGRSVPTVLAIGLGLAYGAFDEWHQAFVPDRMPSVADWFADVAGVSVGYAVATLLFVALSDHQIFAALPRRDSA